MLLHCRFGEEPLHCCEVMLHDMDISKRINTSLKSKVLGHISYIVELYHIQALSDVVDCVLVSDSYWPALQIDTVQHHPIICTLLDSYSAEFVTTKKPMKLDIVPQLGEWVWSPACRL